MIAARGDGAVAPAPLWRERALAAALLLAMLAIPYGNVIFGGRSLVYTDNYNPLDDRLLPQNYGPRMLTADFLQRHNLLEYANFHDAEATWRQWEPSGEFLRRAIQRHDWPWWDPYVGAGAPAMANLTPAFFFPPYLLMVALGNTPALKNAYFLLLLAFAAWCTYLLLRRHGLAKLPSFAGAVAVLLAGGLQQNVGSFIGQTAEMLPPSLLATAWFLSRPSWRRAAVLALVYAAVALASFPPLLVAAFGCCVLYAIVVLGNDPAWRAGAARFAVAALVAMALVGFYYVPAAMAARGLPQVERTYAGAGLIAAPWPVALELLSPTLVEGEAIHRVPALRPALGPGLPYIGVVALLLAGVASASGRTTGRALFAMLAAAVVLVVCKLFGVPPVHWIGHVPGLATIHFAHYLGIPLGILVGMLAAFGVQRLLAGEVTTRRLVIVLALLATPLLALPVIAWRLHVFARPAARSWAVAWCATMALYVVAAAAALATRAASRRRRIAAVAMLLGLLVLEGSVHAAFPRQSRFDVWAHPPRYVDQLRTRRDAGRVFGATALRANAGSAFEVYGLDSLMTFNAPRVFDLYRTYAAPGAYLFLRAPTELPPDGVLDAANIGLVALHHVHEAMIAEALRRGYHRFFDDGFVTLFTRTTPPRYYFSSQARRLRPAAALRALALPHPAREVLVESALPFAAAPNAADDAPVVVLAATRNDVRLRVHAPRAGLVYCAESAMPGWTATVNGRAAPIVAANYAFRAVPVPAGDDVVELRYRPPGLIAGALLSLVGLLALGVIAGRPDTAAALEPWTARAVPPRLAAWRRVAIAVLAVGCAWSLGRAAVPFLSTRRAVRAVVPDSIQAPTFYRVEWGELRLPSVAVAGTTLHGSVTLRDGGSGRWISFSDAERTTRGRGAIRLGYRWLAADSDRLVSDYADRVDLPHTLAPGETATLPLEVRAPSAPGRYRLQIDLVQELVTWFADAGAARELRAVTVRPPP